MCKTQLLSSLPVPPRIIGQKEEEVSVIKDHMVSLLCDVQAYPPPEITWTRDGQLLHFSTGIHILPGQTSTTHNTQIISVRGHFLCLTLITAQMLHYVLFYTLCITGGQMLQLPRARLEDAGQYVCTATNAAGQDQKSILLSVYGEQAHGDPSAQFSYIYR